MAATQVGAIGRQQERDTVEQRSSCTGGSNKELTASKSRRSRRAERHETWQEHRNRDKLFILLLYFVLFAF